MPKNTKENLLSTEVRKSIQQDTEEQKRRRRELWASVMPMRNKINKYVHESVGSLIHKKNILHLKHSIEGYKRNPDGIWTGNNSLNYIVEFKHIINNGPMVNARLCIKTCDPMHDRPLPNDTRMITNFGQPWRGVVNATEYKVNIVSDGIVGITTQSIDIRRGLVDAIVEAAKSFNFEYTRSRQ